MRIRYGRGDWLQASGSKAFAANQHRIVEPDSFHRNRNGQFVTPLVAACPLVYLP
jgi:hypothetical protein